jgi:hypothetical protein
VLAAYVQGDVVAVSPNFNHVLPQIFERPESYEPDRFMPPRDEDKKKPFAYMGFGGGRHACIGQNFAYLQVRTPDLTQSAILRFAVNKTGSGISVCLPAVLGSAFSSHACRCTTAPVVLR